MESFKKFIRSSSVLILAVLMVQSSAFGFSVGVHVKGVLVLGGEVHQSITKNALSQIKEQGILIENPGADVSFAEGAIRSIIEANVKTDLQQNVPYYHFDNESFYSGSSWLIEKKSDIVKLLVDGDISQAHSLLGMALHAVQDFYSHTNWIELHKSGFDRRLGRSLIPNTGSVEVGDGLDLIKPYVQKLTSGYTPPKKKDYLYCHELSDKATKAGHGVFTKDGTDSQNNKRFPCGLNKDVKAREGHDAAKASAIAATKDYVKQVIKEIREKRKDGLITDREHDQAVCRLMGGYLGACCFDGTDDGVDSCSGFEAVFPFPGLDQKLTYRVKGLLWCAWIDPESGRETVSETNRTVRIKTSAEDAIWGILNAYREKGQWVSYSCVNPGGLGSTSSMAGIQRWVGDGGGYAEHGKWDANTGRIEHSVAVNGQWPYFRPDTDSIYGGNGNHKAFCGELCGGVNLSACGMEATSAIGVGYVKRGVHAEPRVANYQTVRDFLMDYNYLGCGDINVVPGPSSGIELPF